MALARRVEEAAGGGPQDLEWAISGDELFLLQARPITVLPRPPQIQPPAEGFWTKDTTHYPMPLTPFGASVYLPAIDRAAPTMGEPFGLLFEGFEQRCLGGEVYVHLIPVGGKERPPPTSWVMWLASRIVPALRTTSVASPSAGTVQVATGNGESERAHGRTTHRDPSRTEARSEVGRLAFAVGCRDMRLGA